MRVYLDDQTMDPAIASVEQAFARASELADDAARVVIEVSADGASLDPALIESPPADDAGIAELRFVSAPLGAFVKTTLLDALPLLDAIVADAGEAADMIQRAQTDEAFEPLERVRAAWAVIHELVHKSSQLLGEAEGPGSASAEADNTLAESLTEIKRTVAAKDWGGLSDELAYETPARVDTWRTLVRELADRAGR